MCLRAVVRKATGATTHRLATVVGGNVVLVQQLRTRVAKAKAQAQLELTLDGEDWLELPN